MSLGLTAASSAIDASIYKKMYGFGTTKLNILNEDKQVNLLRIRVFC